jgi:1-acyl-sn-glycerol-3-phosphate acyltransferase
MTTTEYEATTLAQWGYVVLKHTAAPVIRAIWIRSVTGLENVPSRGGLIIASNHESFMDFLCFASVCRREVQYLAAEKFFDRPGWRLLMALTGQFKLDRYKPNQGEGYKIALSALRQGKAIGIFPEGTRSPDGQLLSAHVGVARLAHRARVPVLLVGMSGTFEILPRHRRWPTLAKCSIRIGAPIVFPEFAEPRLDEDRYRLITDQIMLKIATLTGEVYPHAAAIASEVSI